MNLGFLKPLIFTGQFTSAGLVVCYWYEILTLALIVISVSCLLIHFPFNQPSVDASYINLYEQSIAQDICLAIS